LTNREEGGRALSPPDVVVAVKALACELPETAGLPLSRFSRKDLAAEVVNRDLVAQISGTTLSAWLNEDAIRPWHQHSWIFPRDPHFELKAGRVEGIWEGEPLGTDVRVIWADEKTSIQARIRLHPSLPPGPGQPMRVEF